MGLHMKVIRFFIALLLIVTAISVTSSTRVKAMRDVVPPSPPPIIVAPAGTVIRAVIRNPIPESARPGDPFTAFVWLPVEVNGWTAIPDGAELKGPIQEIASVDESAETTVMFDQVVIHDRSFDIHTQPATALIPALSDLDVLAAGFRALSAATLGASLGAASNDNRLLDGGLALGASAGVGATLEIPLTVTLTRDLEIRT
jgi:hypothetical protein